MISTPSGWNTANEPHSAAYFLESLAKQASVVQQFTFKLQVRDYQHLTQIGTAT
jgi:hypothetical protein